MILLVIVVSLLLGSFLNVCIYRWPRGQSVLWPGSHCPYCRQHLAPADLVPLWSFVRLRGSCRYCGTAISRRYPTVELLTVVSLALVYQRWGFALPTLFWSGMTGLFIVISAIDLEFMLIPSRLVYMGCVWVMIYQLLTGQAWSVRLRGGLLGYALSYVLFHLVPGGIGGGDVRLVGLLGFALGWQRLLLALFLACTGGALVIIVLLLMGKVRRHDRIPFAPFLCSGGWVAALWGHSLLQWYLDLLL